MHVPTSIQPCSSKDSDGTSIDDDWVHGGALEVGRLSMESKGALRLNAALLQLFVMLHGQNSMNDARQ